MTEDEAKTRWCPFARADNANEVAAVNRYRTGPDPECLCIGSACMAFRWEQDGTLCIVEDLGGNECTLTVAEAQRLGWPVLRTIDRTGYCGLAGRP